MKLSEDKMTKEQLKDRIESRLEILKISQADLNNAQQDYANFICPYKVGDMLINTKRDKAKLTKIEFTSMFSAGFELHGIKIKKNGDDYSYQSQLYEYQGWKELGE